MSQLLDDLRMEHVKLSNLFLKIADLGVTSEEGCKMLLDAKAELIAHLKKEDDELYPVLWEMAKNNNELKLKLESFEDDMNNVTRSILAFFEKYAGGKDDPNFGRDFQTVCLILAKRIDSEEAKLFPEYENGV